MGLIYSHRVELVERPERPVGVRSVQLVDEALQVADIESRDKIFVPKEGRRRDERIVVDGRRRIVVDGA